MHIDIVGSLRAAAVLMMVISLQSGTARGEVFSFGGNRNSITNASTAAITSGGFAMQISAQIPGTTFNEALVALGINSQSASSSNDPSISQFNVIKDGQLAGTSESFRFSFDRTGILTGLNFHVIADERLEYFTLDAPDGQRINFFDSAANITIPGAVDAARMDGVITGEVVYLLEESASVDDLVNELSIRFAAGEEFLLTYNELGAEYGRTEDPNGGQLQTITVFAVPEPVVWLMVQTVIAACLLMRMRYSRGQRLTVDRNEPHPAK